jgi:pyruvate dehydrogenase E2 component (dihydrolipoamide acetyltransferase)
MPDGGLITPVLRKANEQDLYSLSRSWKDLVDRARTKQLAPDEYSTGTFTISNLGMFGVDSFDAILPPGQGSIIAIGATRPTVIATKDGMMGVKQQMQVNITCDHRIIYGADAASFLKDLADLIENNVQSLTL